MIGQREVMQWLADGEPVAGERAIIRRGNLMRYEVATADGTARVMVATDDPFEASRWWLHFEGGGKLLAYQLQVGGMELAK